MDGDEAPLQAIAELAERYGAGLIVDEAHATGIFGEIGSGLINHYKLKNKVLARVITFGKALGCHGAAIICNNNLKSFLINFARSFIYTTASPFYTHLSVSQAYQHLLKSDLSLIHKKIKLFKDEASEIETHFIRSNSPIQSLLIPGNVKAKSLAESLQKKGFNVRAILHPTVPEGKERLRICLHTFNTDDEIRSLVKAIKENI
jgi:8-amino-7-oxononanoate synthase